MGRVNKGWKELLPAVNKFVKQCLFYLASRFLGDNIKRLAAAPCLRRKQLVTKTLIKNYFRERLKGLFVYEMKGVKTTRKDTLLHCEFNLTLYERN